MTISQITCPSWHLSSLANFHKDHRKNVSAVTFLQNEYFGSCMFCDTFKVKCPLTSPKTDEHISPNGLLQVVVCIVNVQN